MSDQIIQPAQQHESGEPFDTSEWMKQIIGFDGPAKDFLQLWLKGVCAWTQSTGGGVLHYKESGEIGMLGAYPIPEEDAPPLSWLGAVAGKIQTDAPDKPGILSLPRSDGMYGSDHKEAVAIVPVGIETETLYVAMHLHSEATNQNVTGIVLSQIQALGGMLSLHHRVQVAQQKSIAAERLRGAVSILSIVQKRHNFRAAAMELCNELAARLGSERVSLGILKGRFVHCMGIDHSEKVVRKMQLVTQIEAAMEECLDQETVIAWPCEPHAQFVSQAAAELGEKHGSAQVLSIPIRAEGKVQMVLTIECSAKSLLDPGSVDVIGLLVELASAGLYRTYLHSRWFGARLAHASQKALAVVVGAKHTWIKLLVIGIVALICFAAFVDGNFKVEAPLELESQQQAVVAAPFSGYLMIVNVKPGEPVEANKTILGQLDDSELLKELAISEAELLTYQRRAAMARKESKEAEARIEDAQSQRVQKQIDLLKQKISRSILRSPKSGHVVSDDRNQQIGMAVETGDTLFEIADIQSLRGILRVREDDRPEIKVGLTGQLRIAAHPGKAIDFTITNIQPVAQAVEESNIFEVWIELKQHPDWLHPGMEGEAEICVGQRKYGWIWTRRATNWFQMKLWEWF
ncbi:MAG: HlyD family efflux transporter periplasmic adaptor subunit [Phycisphaerae bacterium]|nr:HlyD family efflux transporter periplasmic adaptor subunit [Phycisphaerae bacterium]